MDAFAHGLIPDLSDPNQMALFSLYRLARLGDPTVKLNADTFARLAKEQAAHPELGKHPFSPAEVTVRRSTYPPAEAILPWIAQLRSLRQQFFSPNEGRDYWTSAFGSAEAFQNFLASDAGRLWTNGSKPSQERLEALFRGIQERWSQAGPEQKARLGQALVDLAAVRGLDAPGVGDALRSGDGRDQLLGLQKLLQSREAFVVEMGYANGMPDLLAQTGRSGVTGWVAEDRLPGEIQAESQRLEAGKSVDQAASTFTVRPLSFAEAPLRSCLGNDCSSRTYLEKALEQRYHYFTVTDASGHSNGHVTLVLGQAHSEHGPVAVAFVDKIQNIANEDLAWVLESVRQSVAKDGYVLCIPVSLGDHNGISNIDSTRSYIAARLKTYTDQSAVLKGFAPEPAAVKFTNEYSRAGLALDVQPLLPLSEPELKTTLKPPVNPWMIRDFSIGRLFEESLRLKSGDVAEKKKFVVTLFDLKRQGFALDPQLEKDVTTWMEGPEPIALKNLILTEYFKDRQWDKIASLRNGLPISQQANLLQNWLQTPAYLPTILKEPEVFVPMARYHLPTLVTLFQALRRWNPEALSKELDRFAWLMEPAEPAALQSALASLDRGALAQLASRLKMDSPTSQDRASIAHALSRREPASLAADLDSAKLAPYSLAVNTLRAIALSGDRTTVQELVGRLPHLSDSLAASAGKRARTLLQPIYDDLRGRGSVAALDPGSVNLDLVSPFPLLPLPDGRFVRRIRRESPDRTTHAILQWIRDGKVESEIDEVITPWPARPAVLPDGTVVAENYHELRFYKDGKLVGKGLRPEGNQIYGSPAVLPNGDLLAGTKDGKLFVIRDGKVIQAIPRDSNEREFFRFRPVTLSDGTVVVANSTISTAGKADIFWIKDGNTVSTYPGLQGSFSTPARLPDDTVVYLSDNGHVLWLKNGKKLHEWSGIQEYTYASQDPLIEVLSDNTVVAALGTRVVWLKDGKLIDSVEGKVEGIQKLPDDSIAVIGRSGAPTRVYSKPSAMAIPPL